MHWFMYCMHSLICEPTYTTQVHTVSISFTLSVFAGDVHAGVQVQGVRFRELLCDLLVHCVSAAGVRPGLVPRPHQGGTSHEGQPG